MSKQKIKTNNAGLFGKKLNLPIAGEVSISEDGYIEVEANVADLLLNRHDGTFVSAVEVKEIEVEEDEEEDEVETEKETPKKPEPKKEETTEEKGEKEETEEEEDGLEGLKLEELIDLAKDAGFKEPSYRKFKKSEKLMIKFLRNNA